MSEIPTLNANPDLVKLAELQKEVEELRRQLAEMQINSNPQPKDWHTRRFIPRSPRGHLV